MTILTPFPMVKPYTDLQYFDIREIVAVSGAYEAVDDGGEPYRVVYLRGGASFSVPVQAGNALIAGFTGVPTRG